MITRDDITNENRRGKSHKAARLLALEGLQCTLSQSSAVDALRSKVEQLETLLTEQAEAYAL